MNNMNAARRQESPISPAFFCKLAIDSPGELRNLTRIGPGITMKIPF